MMTCHSFLLLLVAFAASSESFSFHHVPPSVSPVDTMKPAWPWKTNHNRLVQGAIMTAAWTILLHTPIRTPSMVPMLGPQPAMAAESRLIGQIAGSGLVFKDTLNVESFDDPKVRFVFVGRHLHSRPIHMHSHNTHIHNHYYILGTSLPAGFTEPLEQHRDQQKL